MGFKDIEIRKSEFVTKTQFLSNMLTNRFEIVGKSVVGS